MKVTVKNQYGVAHYIHPDEEFLQAVLKYLKGTCYSYISVQR
jgi:hypothetical protein